MSDLRSRTLKLAASLPKGNTFRRQLLEAARLHPTVEDRLDEADAWSRALESKIERRERLRRKYEELVSRIERAGFRRGSKTRDGLWFLLNDDESLDGVLDFYDTLKKLGFKVPSRVRGKLRGNVTFEDVRVWTAFDHDVGKNMAAVRFDFAPK